MEPRRFDFEGGGLVMDDRFAPIFISTWWGTANIEAADEVFRWSDRLIDAAVRDGRKIVLISDALDVQRPPATVRRYMGERNEAARSEERDAATLANFVVIRSAAVRGALTAIGWFSKRPNNLTPVADMPTAFAQAFAALARAGLAAPPALDPERYRRPVPADLHASSG